MHRMTLISSTNITYSFTGEVIQRQEDNDVIINLFRSEEVSGITEFFVHKVTKEAGLQSVVATNDIEFALDVLDGIGGDSRKLRAHFLTPQTEILKEQAKHTFSKLSDKIDVENTNWNKAALTAGLFAVTGIAIT